jgi:hypothetical protein
MEVDWDGRHLSFSYARYPNGRIAVLLMEGLTRYGRLSTNIAEVEVAPDEFLVPVWNLNEELLRRILATGLFQDTGRRVFGSSWSQTAEGPEPQLWRVADLSRIDA